MSSQQEASKEIESQREIENLQAQIVGCCRYCVQGLGSGDVGLGTRKGMATRKDVTTRKIFGGGKAADDEKSSRKQPEYNQLNPAHPIRKMVLVMDLSCKAPVRKTDFRRYPFGLLGLAHICSSRWDFYLYVYIPLPLFKTPHSPSSCSAALARRKSPWEERFHDFLGEVEVEGVGFAEKREGWLGWLGVGVRIWKGWMGSVGAIIFKGESAEEKGQGCDGDGGFW
jgi:hypothetical protein